MKKISIIVMACLAIAPAVNAQNSNDKKAGNKDKEELYQVVIGDKDFVPVKRNVVMKNTLPEVKKPTVKNAVTPDYSKQAVATVVPNRVPTMLPYGYRTGHNFSAQRGYLDLGAGTQLNIAASLGYRFIDEEDLNLEAWAQHNSTWEGKNGSMFHIPEDRQKQRYNDNVLGLDVEKVFKGGTLAAGARFHYDSFNYYGGPATTWRDEKQGFMAFSIGAGWKGRTHALNDHPLDYHAGVKLDYGKYEKGIYYYLQNDNHNPYSADEVVLAFNGGVDFKASTTAHVGVDLEATFVGNDRGHIEWMHPFYYATPDFDDRTGAWDATDSRISYGVIDISPYFRYEGESFRALAGVHAILSASDGAKAQVSPRVQVDADLSSGVVFYANAMGGKTIHTLSSLHEATRYVNPSRYVRNTFSPLDLEAGLRLGPWRGFSADVFAGYGIFRDAIAPMTTGGLSYAFVNLYNLRTRGVKVGAHINYQYRSLIEVDAKFTYAPQDDEPLADGKCYAKSYFLGLDGASTVGSIDLTVRPIRKLSLGVGFDYRGGRRVTGVEQASFVDEFNDITYYPPMFTKVDLTDVLNLRVRAEYRITPRFGVWAQASNLLGKRWDLFPGMSCQNTGVMAGISVNF